MPRPPRIDFPGAIHHVMNRGLARQQTFFTDADRVEFGARLAAIHDRFGVETLAYALMGNHFHLLLRTPGGDLPAAMKHLGQTYTRHVNDRLGRDGPLFRGRYHSIVVTTDAYLLMATRYIHRNALDVRGICRPEDYRWSSYRAYLGLRRAPSFLRTDVVLGHFGHDPERLRHFTDSDEEADHAAIETLADLLARAELAVALDDLRRGDDAIAPTGVTRTALVVLSERLTEGPLRDALLAHLGSPTRRARNEAVRRARSRSHDDRVDRVVRAVIAGTNGV